MVKIQLRRGTAATWASANPVLLDGEPGLESDTGQKKYGDGVTAWNSLGYYYSDVPDGTIVTESLADFAVTGDKILDGSVNSAKIDVSDTFAWLGPHVFFSDTLFEGVACFNNASVKLGTSVTYTTDNSSALWFNLKSDLKTAGILLIPSVPSVTLTANDGAGNFTTVGLGSGGMNWQFGGVADLALNSIVGGLNEVIVAQGNNSPPIWRHLCPPIRYSWTDFFSPNTVQSQDPYVGAAIGGGLQSGTPAAAYRIDGVAGLCLLQSAASSNTGFRWTAQNTDRIKGQADLYFRAILAICDDMTSKTIHFGFLDATTQTESTDGAYFLLSAGSLACVAKTANGGTRTTGSSFSLTAGTYYVFEVYWTTNASIKFTIKSLDEATTHLDTDITTNIPTSNTALFGAGLVATSSGAVADDLLVVDYMGHGFKNRR